MKLHGKTIVPAEPEVIVIPRQKEDIILYARPVLSFDDYEKLNPKPMPPEIVKPGGEKSYAINDETYTKKLREWANKKTAWMILESLSATDGLVWDTVDLNNPETWDPEAELKQSGFSDLEIAKIITTVLNASGLSEKRIETATQSFLAGAEVLPGDEASPSTEPQSTQSGELANDSESDLQE